VQWILKALAVEGLEEYSNHKIGSVVEARALKIEHDESTLPTP
jgi:hypothetical protein